MATPLTNSINALTAYANEVTGGSDTNLSDAVHTLASGYGGGSGNVKTGSFTQAQTSSVCTIDVGSNDWTHLLVIPRVYPYAVGASRCIGVKYVNMQWMRMVSAYGASSDTSTTASAGSSWGVSVNTAQIQVNDGVVTFGGAASQVGAFIANCVYDWYAW